MKERPTIDAVALALRDVFTTPNESDSNGEVPNVVDALYYLGRELGRIADALEKDRDSPTF